MFFSKILLDNPVPLNIMHLQMHPRSATV